MHTVSHQRNEMKERIQQAIDIALNARPQPYAVPAITELIARGQLALTIPDDMKSFMFFSGVMSYNDAAQNETT